MSLLQEPKLALLIELGNIPASPDIPGLDFLAEIIGLVHENPQIEVATLYSRLEGSRYYHHLKVLSGQEQLLDGNLLEFEFKGILDAIEKLVANQSLHEHMEKLFAKPPSELTDEEKAMIKRYSTNNSLY